LGDSVCTYYPSPRLYLIGTIESKVEHRDHPLSRVRKVKWTRKAVRDSLKKETRNTMGSIATFFQIRDGAAEDLWDRSVPIDADLSVSEPEGLIETDGDNKVLLDEVATKAMELIEDRIARLNWEEMQQLVGELLIAMGYRARISPKGADRGRDIFASPDGLGMQEPRIFVEVKHRLGSQMGSNEIRAFLGGRQPGDRCLYVSTGGFTKEARYEAERSSIPITLITLPELRELLVEHYESLRPLGTSLVPLERLYWPTN
jgi:restriction system protein